MISRPRPGSDELVIRIDGDEDAAAAHLLAWGWTDGLPIVVPTVERVERMCAGSRHQADYSLGHIAPRGAPLTVRHLAANAVMAGCVPEYMPVLEAAVAAMQEGMCHIDGRPEPRRRPPLTHETPRAARLEPCCLASACSIRPIPRYVPSHA